MASNTDIKLIYFPIKGLGEPIRFMLAYLGKDYEDYRCRWVEWVNEIKPNTPWGKIPVLEIDGQRVTQNIPIVRYLGKEAGLGGKDNWEELRIDEIINVIDDLRAELAKYNYERDENRRAAVKVPLFNEIVPFYMKKLDAHIKENNGYLANGKLSWADLYFAAVSDYLSYMYESDITEGYPNVSALKERVYALPQIKEWVEKRIPDIIYSVR